MRKKGIKFFLTSDKVFDVINTALLVVITLVILYPLYFTVIASFSDPHAVSRGEVMIWIKDFTLKPYKNVFLSKEIWTGYQNSIINTAIVVIYALCVTIPASFVMSRKNLKGKKFFSNYFIITMYFGGGMIPTYLLVKDLGLMNTRLALILPAGFSVYNMIIAKAFMQSNLSEELFEAARIDGCSIFGMFFQIALPLSKAVIAVVALYVAVAQWGAWFNALLYIQNKDLYPLQYVLRNILFQNKQIAIMESENADVMASLLERNYMAQGMKYSLIFISALPMLILYPFVQKYFVKGVMVGAVKS